MAGLRFTCQQGCTNCCNQRGFVYLTERDVLSAAAFLGMTTAAFARRYLYRTRTLRRLRKPKHSQCHFLTERGCSIYPARPTQCRTFPFWPELVGNPEAWSATGQYCPGIGKGELIQIGTALEMAHVQERAYPEIYPPIRSAAAPPSA